MNRAWIRSPSPIRGSPSRWPRRTGCGSPRTIEALPDGHPRKRLVVFMALYAREILTGTIPGPYNDEDAERFARLALVDADVINGTREPAPRSSPSCWASPTTS